MTNRPSLTREKKSEEMRLRLIQATLDSLNEHGYHGASLSRILEKAGVSRGAWSHHFDSKKDLVAAAAQWMYRAVMIKGREVIPLLAEQSNLTAAMEFIWDHFYQGRYRNVWLEITIACRTDRELNRMIKPVIDRFYADMQSIIREIFGPSTTAIAPVETLMNISFYFFRGMSIQSIVREDPEEFRAMRRQWINMIAPILNLLMPGAFHT